MTFIATPQPANVPPRVRLDIDSDDAGAAFTSLEVKRDGTPIREQPFVGGPEALTFDYEAPFGVSVTYTAEGLYIPSATPDWTEVWASLAAWTGATADFSVAGGKASSSVSGADITRSTSGTIQRLSVTDPALARVELLTSADVVVCALEVAASNVTLTGTSSTSTTGGGSFTLTLTDGVVTAGAVDLSWSLTREYAGVPTKVRVVAASPGYSRTATGSISGTPIIRGIAVDPATDDVFASIHSGEVWHFDSDLNFIESWPTDEQLYDIAIGASGNLYGAFAFNTVYVYDLAGNLLDSWATGGSTGATSRLAIDSAENVYVLDSAAKTAMKFNSAGAPVTSWSVTGTPRGIAVDSANVIHVTDLTNNLVRRYSATGVAGSTFAIGSTFSNGLAVDASGSVFIANPGSTPGIRKYNSAGAYQGGFIPASFYVNEVAENTGAVYVGNTDGDLEKWQIVPSSVGQIAPTLIATEQTFFATTSTQLDVDEAWLIHPSQPSLSLAIDVGPNGNQTDAVTYVEASTNNEQTSRAERTLRRTVGRRKAVIFTHGPRQADEWTLVLGTETTAAKDAIRALVDDQTPLLLRTPVTFDWDLPDDWYSVGDFSKNRQQDFSSSKLALSTLPLTPVDEPIVRQGAVWTWGDVLTTYDTWQDVLDAYDTWLDVLAGPSS